MHPTQERVTWILEARWTLEDQRTSLRQRHTVGQQELWVVMSIFHAALQEYRRQRVSTSGAEIEALIATG